MTTTKRNIDDILSTPLGKLNDNGLDASKKRSIDVQHKIDVFEQIFKRMRCDSVLTEAYLEKLKVNYAHIFY